MPLISKYTLLCFIYFLEFYLSYIPIFLLRPLTIILNTAIQSIVARDIIQPESLSHLRTWQSAQRAKIKQLDSGLPGCDTAAELFPHFEGM